VKAIKFSLILFSFLFLTTSCFFEDEDDTPITTREVNDFVWKAMNSWYNWQSQVSDLSDTKDDNISTYNSYLDQFANPEDLFNNLRYQIGTIDRFSWFIDNYIEQELSFQGISKSFGMRLKAVQISNSDGIIIYVRHVADNSPASNANIKRGDIINAIDGVVLTNTTYNDASDNLSNDTVTLSFVSEDNGVLTPIENKTISSMTNLMMLFHLLKMKISMS